MVRKKDRNLYLDKFIYSTLIVVHGLRAASTLILPCLLFVSISAGVLLSHLALQCYSRIYQVNAVLNLSSPMFIFSSDGLRRVFQIQPNFLLRNSAFISLSSAFSHSCSLEILGGQSIRRILSRHLLTNALSFF